jgi:hypothetical protein
VNIEMYELPDAKVSLKMQCDTCGHIQHVKGSRHDGQIYFGSSYNWCDACDTGLPVAIDFVEIVSLLPT